MDAQLLRRLGSGFYPLIAMVLVLMLSFSLLGEATQNSARFGRLYSFLLILNGAGILILFGLIGAHLMQLRRQLRERVTGARLTKRMVILFVLLALLPASTVYYYSLQFLHRSIDSWFDVRIESALSDALELSRNALDQRMSQALRGVRQATAEFVETDPAQLPVVLGNIREALDAVEMAIFSPGGRILAFSSTDPTDLVPDIPSESAFLQIRQGIEVLRLEPRQEALYIRAISAVPPDVRTGERSYLQAIFHVPGRPHELADSVQIAYGQYKELAYLRTPLKYSFTVTLSLILLLSLLAAVWSAFFSASRLSAPIRALAEGTRAVASGDYGRQLPKGGADEMGQLIHSFNDMSRRIALARDAAQRSRQQVEEQRAYLETVLGHLSSGVITIDANDHLRAANSSAGQILDLPIEAWVDRPWSAITAAHPHLRDFHQLFRQHLRGDDQDWQEEFHLNTPQGRKTLMCQGSRLPVREGIGENVVVFDDITALIKAQREAAWAEVARRLAHEIKNPLTPIRLAAERLRHKYLGQNPIENGDLLDRYTHTIMQQVESMRSMVDAFSHYARNPRMRLEPVALNNLIEEIAELYRHDVNRIDLELDPALPPIQADPHRIGQILHNLIKNAIEAAGDGSAPEIEIQTRDLAQMQPPQVEFLIADKGRGFDPAVLDRLFEPYTTTKPRGTGLGLAIVQKIVEEHRGQIEVINQASGGALVAVRLPLEPPLQEGGALPRIGEPHG